MADEQGKYVGEVEILLHKVSYHWEIDPASLDDSEMELLDEAAEEEAKRLIANGLDCGELDCYLGDDGDAGREVSGWWQIV